MRTNWQVATAVGRKGKKAGSAVWEANEKGKMTKENRAGLSTQSLKGLTGKKKKNGKVQENDLSGTG